MRASLKCKIKDAIVASDTDIFSLEGLYYQFFF